MKQLKRRAIFVLIFALLLTAGAVLFCVRYAAQGREWATSSVNMSAYSGGSLSSGTLYDRNGILLYDCETQSYADSALTRRATLHLIGDLQGNIAVGARKLFAEQLAAYNPITGLSAEGNNVYLSVDAALNETAYEALNGRSGTVAVYNYETGEVLCMVSAPSFDPTNSEQVAAVASGDSTYSGAYLNRFLSSTYTPGSTFKLVTSAAALETLGNMSDFSFTCTGSYQIGNDTVTCPYVHGEQNFEAALSNSCNCAYACLALQLGGNTLERYAEKAGLLDSLDISGVSTAKGSFTVAEDDTLDLGWSGVGQYQDLVCPANMLTLMGCIAGNGSAASPRLLSRVTSRSGLPAAGVSKTTASIGWSSSTCKTLKSMMRNNVTATYGQSQFGDLAVCAKSGTAEVGGDAAPHAWFVGFIDDAEHPYAFVVVVENGGWGSSTAGSIAAEVLNELCAED